MSPELTRILKNHQPQRKEDISQAKKQNIAPEKREEFEQTLKNHFREKEIENEIKVSKHATKRLMERNIDIDSGEFLKLKKASDILKTKGGRDSLIITDKAAYIMDLSTNTVVTALDKNNLESNVVTNIDSTIFM